MLSIIAFLLFIRKRNYSTFKNTLETKIKIILKAVLTLTNYEFMSNILSPFLSLFLPL